LARYRFRGREALFTIFVMGLLFPATVAIIPLFIIITRDLGLGNTWWGVALPQAAFALPLTVVILRPFLAAIPTEIEEAALLDGASRLGFFWRILLPLSGPGMVTVGVLADRKSTRLNSSHVKISYAVFCMKKKSNRRVDH